MAETVVVEGLDKVLSQFDEMISQMPADVDDAAMDWALNVKGESQIECPVNTGLLRGSAYVERDGDDIVLGYSMGYAVYVHENLEAHHAPPTKAKFLIDPVMRELDALQEQIAERLRSTMDTEGGA
jgi:hypothetical protein